MKVFFSLYKYLSSHLALHPWILGLFVDTDFYFIIFLIIKHYQEITLQFRDTKNYDKLCKLFARNLIEVLKDGPPSQLFKIGELHNSYR